MGWQSRLWKICVSVVRNLFLFAVIWLLWIPTAQALSPKQAATSGNHTELAVVADTPTPDPTVVALTKEQLQQQVEQLQFQNEHNFSTWFWNSSGTIIAAIVTLAAAYLAFRQWQSGQKTAQDKDRNAQKIAQDKDLQDQREERAKEKEDRFQKVVEGLGSNQDAVRIGAAVMLQRFVQPGYPDINAEDTDSTEKQPSTQLHAEDTNPSEKQPSTQLQNDHSIYQAILRFLRSVHLIGEKKQPQPEHSQDDQSEQLEGAIFHRQAFDLAVAYLRTLPQLDDKELTQSPKPLNQALTSILRDVYPLVRGELQKTDTLKSTEYINPELLFRMLDAGYVNLDLAYLYRGDLTQIWMPGALLRGAFLQEAKLSGAYLRKAHLSQANLSGANLTNADLVWADLTNVQLMNADLTGADLTHAILESVAHKQATFNKINSMGASTPQTDTDTEISTQTDLTGANLTDVDFTNANLTGANLSSTHPEKASSLHNTIMIGVTGLTDPQREACKTMGAIFEETHEETKIATDTP